LESLPLDGLYAPHLAYIPGSGSEKLSINYSRFPKLPQSTGRATIVLVFKMLF